MNHKVMIIKSVDEVLKPLRFYRRNGVWNRKSPPFTDVVDIQICHIIKQVTVNAGVYHPEMYMSCWDDPPRGLIQESECTVRTRIGRLIDNLDVWWPLEHPDAPVEIPRLIKQYVLPFLDKMHSFEAMAEYLGRPDKIKWIGVPEIIYLAMIKKKLGDHEGAYNLMVNRRKMPKSAWDDRLQSITEMLRLSL